MSRKGLFGNAFQKNLNRRSRIQDEQRQEAERIARIVKSVKGSLKPKSHQEKSDERSR